MKLNILHQLKLLELLILLLLPLSAHSQNLQITNFEECTFDVTANLKGTTVPDQNGNKCALIRVKTPLAGLSYDVGVLGVQKIEPKPDMHETWVYVPAGVRKIIVSHKEYKSTEYELSFNLKGSKVYEMDVDLEGKIISINTHFNGAVIRLDGDSIGTTSVNRHVSYGIHFVVAESGKIRGEQTINVSKEGPGSFDIKMENMSKYYGKVTISVSNNAEIFFDGKSRGIGSWFTELKEGRYTVETRKENCENSITTFTVKPQSQNNIVANAPVPYHGFLQATTEPLNVMVSSGNRSVNSGEKLQIELGKHEVTYSKKGYISQTKLYTIERDKTITDNIKLKRFYRVKSTTVYAGAGATYASSLGVSAFVGGTFKNIDLEGSYTLGMSKSEEVNWFSSSDNAFNETCTYNVNQFAVKMGYQIRVASSIAVTPQVGFRAMMLKSSGERGNGTYCGCAAIGAKLLLSPFNHLYVFVSPEYAVPVKKTDTYTKIADCSNISAGGFVAHLGLLVNL